MRLSALAGAAIVLGITLFRAAVGQGQPTPIHTLEYRAQIAEPHPPRLILPVKGRIRVWDGHDPYSHHRRWDYSNPMLCNLGYTANFRPLFV
ncbi:MAG TPA: hypothetical protein VL286_08020 [Rhizomicrobium sp.]|jgi:hypothetical protein|nr:hypothetical protein [Rhizomicrobium sp.]